MREPWLDELLADAPPARPGFREQLRDHLVDAWREDGSITINAERQRPRQRSWTPAVAVAATALLVTGLIVVANRDDTSEPIPAATTTDSSSPVDDVLESRRGHWRRMPGAPLAARGQPAAVITADEFVIWGGRNDGALDDGAAYSFDEGDWRTIAPAPLPPRSSAAAVWTGEEVLIWGGEAGTTDSDRDAVYDGAAWNPQTDTWRKIPSSGVGALVGRTGAAWTGKELVLVDMPTAANVFVPSDTIAIDPATGDWRPLDPIPTPQPGTRPDRGPYEVRGRTAVFTGDDVLVVTVADGFGVTIDRLDPVSGTWAPTVTTSLPGLNVGPDGVAWTGSELVIVNHLGAGAVFDPADNSLRAIESSRSVVRFPAVALGNDILSVGDRWLDVRSGTWNDAAPVPDPHGEFPVAGGSDHSLYIWGGDGCGPAADCAGFVDPGRGLTWTLDDEVVTASETNPSNTSTVVTDPATMEIPKFTSMFACAGGDLFVNATIDDGSIALVVRSGRHVWGKAYNRTADLPDANVAVELVQGTEVDDPLCNDVIGSDYRVDRRIGFDSGSVTITVDRGIATVVFNGLRSSKHPDVELATDRIVAPIGALGG